MKTTVIILGLTIFTFISCSENKSKVKDAEVIEVINEDKTETKNVIETKDEPTIDNAYEFIDTIKYIKEFDLFWLRDVETKAQKKVGFISLSDIYTLSEHPDSLAIPNHLDEEETNLQYFKLNSTYRNRFLSKTNISETDSVFIYDYSTDILRTFPVKKLNVAAYLNTYMNIDDCPCNQYDYMIGFEVPINYLNGFGKYYNDVFVFIGKENPFTMGQMKAIVWQKINTAKFPSEKSNLTERQIQYIHKNTIKGEAYLYETDTYQFLIQDYTESNNINYIQNRHLIIINKQTDNVVNEIMYGNSEGSSIAPLNFGIDNPNFKDLKEQWTGKLFKDKPEVLFGFEWISFGCPGIMFVNSQDKYVQINCDNRH